MVALSSPTGSSVDKRSVMYNIVSGTSMACPHVTGAAAYVKSFHRDWSPAMIMSALITTGLFSDGRRRRRRRAQARRRPVQPGEGTRRDPGLVYDATVGDYIEMLCAQGYNATQLAVVTGSDDTACGAASDGSVVADLNYPTMAAHVAPGERFALSFPRTVTNVGAAPAAVYDARVVAALSGVVAAANEVASVAVVWTDGEHEVEEPCGGVHGERRRTGGRVDVMCGRYDD
ncbi:subtilisin-like protease SBT4.3 [Oryza brachyantha]|uniref:subtilisin-like protease SBT4.3 n=1 Tax=Oryza brachyantha TaxID=4533 RepID=UPI001ADD28B6|nr:subtilisin-like protease SBT4.3 [Oryza brachyantha]